jgi:hypothetical protein
MIAKVNKDMKWQVKFFYFFSKKKKKKANKEMVTGIKT